MNREEWLNELASELRPAFKQRGADLPEKLRLTRGWPSRKAHGKARVIGECWKPQASKDNTVEVFISPVTADAVEVGAVLVHELVHASGCYGHKANFKKIAESLGLTGPMRSTVAGHELKERLNALTDKIGPYPHAVLDQTQNPTKKQSTRMLKALCPDCGYTVRLAKKWAEIALPTCTVCDRVMELQGDVTPKEGEETE